MCACVCVCVCLRRFSVDTESSYMYNAEVSIDNYRSSVGFLLV